MAYGSSSCGSSVPSLSSFSPPPHPTDVPAAASRLHYQQWAAPPHGRVLPRQCAFQRAADLHLVSDTCATPAMARGQRDLAWAPGATGTCAGSGQSRTRGGVFAAAGVERFWLCPGSWRGHLCWAAVSAQPLRLSAAEVPSYCRMQSVACAVTVVVATRLLNSELPLECVYFVPTAPFIQ